jgi:hypothetical protein
MTDPSRVAYALAAGSTVNEMVGLRRCAKKRLEAVVLSIPFRIRLPATSITDIL